MNDRIWRYELRDYDRAGYVTKIYEHDFCVDCRSKQCSNVTHNHIELHPIIRIPRKNASKKKWKEFFEQVERFGESNKRYKRH